MQKNIPFMFILKTILICIAFTILINCKNETVLPKTLLKEDDCKTPFDCYLKAIEVLKTDRAEMRRQMDSLNDQYQKNLQEMERKINETTAKYEDLLLKTKTECNNQINNLNENLNNFQNAINQRVTQLDSSVLRHLSLTSVHQGGRVSQCPDGFLAVSCSCGSGCGSWGIDGKTCTCGCGEWSQVNCVKLNP